jgi:hypothetical protein
LAKAVTLAIALFHLIAVARHPVARAGTIVTPTIAPLTISK